MATKKTDRRWTSIPMTSFPCRCGCGESAMAFYAIKAVCDGCKIAMCPADACMRPRLKSWDETVAEANSKTFDEKVTEYNTRFGKEQP